MPRARALLLASGTKTKELWHTMTAEGERRGAPRLGERVSGVLLHPTSLPGLHGIGDLGSGARHFLRFLRAAGQRFWQVLPLGPTGYGDSPYSAESTFAGNPLLIDLAELAAQGLLTRDEIAGSSLPADRVDHAAVARFKSACLRIAAARFAERLARSGDPRARFAAFCEAERGWLDDFALYTAEKRRTGAPWWRWEDGLRARDPAAVARLAREQAETIAAVRFEQWAFARQLGALRADAADHGIGLIGDIPIFVAHDSADVWQRQHLFRLDEGGRPEVVAGVPPDYFSRTGQRWGNPVYRWEVVAREGYGFWIDRVRAVLRQVDVARLDHFIGFVRGWEIPADHATAEAGAYRPGPGEALFLALRDALGGALPLIAEDLGAVTPEVTRLRERLGLPGMRVLELAFGDDPGAPAFLPHAYERRTVAYTGTHDNDTARGWMEDRGGPASTRTAAQCDHERRLARAYLGSDGREPHWDMIRAVLASVADTAVVPLQDVLGQGSEARMNQPGTASGNWTYRVRGELLTRAVAARLGRLTRLYGRSAEDPRELGEPRMLGDFGLSEGAREGES